MTPSPATALGLVFVLSEAGLAIFKRANKGKTRAADRGTLIVLWGVIVISINAAYVLGASAPQFAMGAEQVPTWLGGALFAVGIGLRWYAITYLGRFFTVDVAIAVDHRIVDTGPYAWIRHPSYTGALTAFVGLGVCIGNWASLAVIAVPTFLVFSWRIRVEEAALLRAFGPAYGDYMRDTKRLIPRVY